MSLANSYTSWGKEVMVGYQMNFSASPSLLQKEFPPSHIIGLISPNSYTSWGKEVMVGYQMNFSASPSLLQKEFPPSHIIGLISPNSYTTLGVYERYILDRTVKMIRAMYRRVSGASPPRSRRAFMAPAAPDSQMQSFAKNFHATPVQQLGD
ncbi:hypothetical protein J6590_065167 [Homalodisca vitripennis]|nr:hypothetical protein J6590_065167 [Homalodisca vitripennis]